MRENFKLGCPPAHQVALPLDPALVPAREVLRRRQALVNGVPAVPLGGRATYVQELVTAVRKAGREGGDLFVPQARNAAE